MMKDWKAIWDENEKYRLSLKEKFPTLFSETHPNNMDFPVGWRPLVEKLCEDILATRYEGCVVQVKEKFAGLRFYLDAASEEVYALIQKAEEESYKICEECGAPVVENKTIIRGWIRTLCYKCKEEQKKEYEELKAEQEARRPKNSLTYPSEES